MDGDTGMDASLQPGEEARQRLSAGPVTSDLSVDELGLLETLGLRPLGLALGSSIYHVGWQRARVMDNTELTVLSQAMHTAREYALKRMLAEAGELGADGIVGVRLTLQQPAWGSGLIEFIAMGTAIGGTGGAGAPAGRQPFASNLSGQDFWKLRRYGYQPVGLAFGCCVYHVAHLGLQKWMQQIGRNAEMTSFTQATYDARELAMARMGADAREAGGDLVVGVSLNEGTWGWDANVIEFSCLGTAVTRDPQRPEPPQPQLVLGMQSGGGATASLGAAAGLSPQAPGTATPLFRPKS